MTLSNSSLDRGMVGNTPALSTRADEAFLDFMCDARNVIMHAHTKPISTLGNTMLKNAGLTPVHTHDALGKIRELIADTPDLAMFLRVKRSAQERYKQRIIDSFF